MSFCFSFLLRALRSAPIHVRDHYVIVMIIIIIFIIWATEGTRATSCSAREPRWREQWSNPSIGPPRTCGHIQWGSLHLPRACTSPPSITDSSDYIVFPLSRRHFVFDYDQCSTIVIPVWYRTVATDFRGRECPHVRMRSSSAGLWRIDHVRRACCRDPRST